MKIETIKQYQKIKSDILKEVGDGILSPYSVSYIMDVPMEVVEGVRELVELKKLKGFNTFANFDYSYTLENTATFKEMEEYGDRLLSIIYISRKMLFFFIMENNKMFRIRSASLRHSRLSAPMVRNLLSVFEKYKIEELKERATWIPIQNRWEILDL